MVRCSSACRINCSGCKRCTSFGKEVCRLGKQGRKKVDNRIVNQPTAFSTCPFVSMHVPWILTLLCLSRQSPPLQNILFLLSNCRYGRMQNAQYASGTLITSCATVRILYLRLSVVKWARDIKPINFNWVLGQLYAFFLVGMYTDVIVTARSHFSHYNYSTNTRVIESNHHSFTVTELVDGKNNDIM